MIARDHLASSELERAREALMAIPPDIPREEWVRVGMAVHAAGLGEDDFHSWSEGGSTYNTRSAREVWRSFKPGKGIGAGTLFAVAKEHGWKQPVNGHDAAPARSQERPKARAEGLTAAQLFERFTSAPADHPYVIEKQGTPDGLRVVPADDPMRLSGESMVGALVVPVLDAGQVVTLQFIAPPETAERLRAQDKPRKLNLAGHSLGAGWFTVGELELGALVYVCEGIGQAWAAWKATGRPAVVCFGWGRMRTVAAAIKAQDPKARLVLVPDVGKEDDAERIAAELVVQWVRMPAGWPQNADINDLALRDGFDVLEELLAAAEGPAGPAGNQPQPLDFRALGRRQAPPRKWFVPGWLGGPTLVAGPGGSGKSSLVQHQVTLGALGRAYVGTQDVPFRSLVWNCEDEHDELWRRQERICAHEKIDMADLDGKLHIVSRYGCENALMVEMQGGLATTALFKELREQVNDLRIDVLWLDNSAHVFLGNHDDRTHVTGFVNALNGLVTGRPFAAVIMAHPGKAIGSEYSGSVAWENAVRMRWYLGSRLPDQRIEDAEDEGDRSTVRYLAKRKANYTAQDYVRFTMQDGLLVPDQAPQGIGGIVAAIDERQAEHVCLEGFRSLKAMGLNPSDSKSSADYLPKQMLEKRLNSGYGKSELAKAMNRLMTAGTFSHGEVGKYSNRTPRMGLVLNEGAT